VTVAWRKLHNEELRNLCSSIIIIIIIVVVVVVVVVIRLRKRRVGHVTRIGKMINAYKILIGKPEGQDHLGKLGIDGTIILKLILKDIV
jgi:hypothetical protein